MSKEIKLTLGLTTIVDDEDYERLLDRKWQAKYNLDGIKVYAFRKNKKSEYMHRVIMNVTDRTIHVDHINGNSLDNRKENLRICSRMENGRNRIKHTKKSSSRFKGVSWNKEFEKWYARITVDRKTKSLGAFNSEIEAAKAYNKAAKDFFGEFALINNINEIEDK